ncbi:putative C2H2 finger domain protein [Aspergillus mulundensis]|uniref:C2H2-type domain-containing protein n=1 Tax=Aspergillus mulundensis TaxID=1810919 RepID=A0A3D8R9E4_9EURO|nr:hypothetical protein DSM5745_07995 [Aspergillus mulundensis]RDW70484.1 hypothetical protein DSM5745_07995 [Aspergillus mulundensis]
MADEQFPWLDWPHPQNYAPTNMSQNTPRVEENSNSHWRSPFYNSSSNPNVQTSVNTNNSNNNTQAQYYPTYQQQEESYVRLEDVLPYPSYRWGPPPAREYQRQATYAESQGSGLPTTSLPQQSPNRPTSRQLPTPMPQAQSGSGESNAAEEAYSGHDAKRRKVEASILQTASRAVPKVASPVYSQVRTPVVPPDSQTSNYNTTQTPNPPISQPAAQPAVQRTSQLTPQRPGSQYVAPTQARPTAQVQPQRTASPAMQTQRVSQYAPQAQQKATPRATSSSSPQINAQQLSRRASQYASPQTSSQTLPTTVAPSATQFTAQQHAQPPSQPKSQYASPNPPPQSLPQTVAPSDTQIRPPPPYIPPSRPFPQMQAQAHPQNSRQSAPQPASQATSTNKQATEPATKAASQPASRPSTQQPTSQSVPPPAKTATPPVPQQVPQTLPHQRPPSTQTVPSGPASSQPQQPASHLQPPGPHGRFAAYTFKPENPSDRTHLKRRSDIVSKLNEADAAQKTAYEPQTIARDILIAAGRHPTEACLNHHLLRLRDVFTAVDMNSDLATFKWDLVDPGHPSRETLAKVAKHRAAMQTKQTAPPPAPAVQVALPVNNTFIPQQPSQRQHNPSPPTLQHVQPPPPPPPPPQQSKFRVQPQVQLQSQQPVPSPVPQRVSQTQNTPSTPNTPNTPNSMEKKRRGRPPGSTNKPKVPAAPVAPPQPTSSYPVFACRWNNCQSELHNLDVLKKHIFKSHVSHQITCGWKNCQFTGTLPAAELMKHVKKEHLDSLAWKLGDGPAVATSVDLDSSSSTVPLTIPESNQPGNEDSLIFPADYRSIRAFNKVHGNSSQQEKAQEIFRAVQRLKEHIGVGLDPGGCELASPLRNQRVSTEEDVYEVRSAS